MEKYKKISLLGSGSFGTAWLVHNHKDEECVIKEISIPLLKHKEKESAINEVKILSKLKHKNIVRYKEAFMNSQTLCICMEYADDGDLYKKIKGQCGKLFLELKIIDWFVQILIAVKYIHSLNILHRDLKSQNIFLTKSGLVKIGDFGISRVLSTSFEHAKTTIGTPCYLSPEICLQKPYNSKSDMWSLGVLLYELCTLHHPFLADDFSSLVVKIITGKYQPIPCCYGPLLQDLVLVLLQVPADDRPSASQLLKVPSLQIHLKSYLMKVRHKEEPVIFDSGICSCSDDEKACSKHLSKDSIEEKDEINVAKDRATRRYNDVSSGAEQKSVSSNDNTISSTSGNSSTDSSVTKTRRTSVGTDASGKRKSVESSTLNNRGTSAAQIKRRSTEQKRRSESSSEISYESNDGACDKKSSKPPIPLKSRNIVALKSSPKNEKVCPPSQKKTPKINFIERNRNLARTPPSRETKYCNNSPAVRNSDIRTRRIQSTPECRDDEKLTPKKSYSLRSRTRSNDPKIPLMVTRVRHLSTKNNQAGNPAQSTNNQVRPPLKYIEADVRFPSVRKRAASLMSLANNGNVQLKLTKRSVSCEDRAQMMKNKPNFMSRIANASKNQNQNHDMTSCKTENQIKDSEVEDNKCIEASKQPFSADKELHLETTELHKPLIVIERSYTDLDEAVLRTDPCLKIQERSQRRSLSNLPQGTCISNSVKTKIAIRLRAASCGHNDEEIEKYTHEDIAEETIGDKFLLEVSRHPLHSTMIDEMQQNDAHIKVPIEQSTLHYYSNKENFEFKRPVHPLSKKAHTSTYTLLRAPNDNILSNLYATLIKSLGIRKFNATLELAKRTTISQQDLQLVQHISGMLGDDHREFLPELLQLVHAERL